MRTFEEFMKEKKAAQDSRMLDSLPKSKQKQSNKSGKKNKK